MTTRALACLRRSADSPARSGSDPIVPASDYLLDPFQEPGPVPLKPGSD
jgi:hypothetical protein